MKCAADNNYIESSKRGRITIEEWQNRSRYALRHIDDPLALEWSPICRLPIIDKIAKEKYRDGVLPHGRALHDFVLLCLEEIEHELDGHQGVAKLKQFIQLTRQGAGVKKASLALGLTTCYVSREFKKILVELFAEKMMIELKK
jgi:hypothetical protein